MWNWIRGRGLAVGVEKVNSGLTRFDNEGCKGPLADRWIQTGIELGRVGRTEIPDITKLAVGAISKTYSVNACTGVSREKESCVVVDRIGERLEPKGNRNSVGVDVQCWNGRPCIRVLNAGCIQLERGVVVLEFGI